MFRKNKIKNIFLLVLSIVLLTLSSCSEDKVQNLFDKDITDRKKEIIAEYSTALLKPEHGWKVEYAPNNNYGVYSMVLKFNADLSVDITSDYANGKYDYDSSYRVGVEHFPELVFESYTVFHELFEANGFLLSAEYQFVFTEITEEGNILFVSKTDTSSDHSEILFVPATATDKADIIAKRPSQGNLETGLGKGFKDGLEDGFEDSFYFKNFIVFDGKTPVYSSNFRYWEAYRVIEVEAYKKIKNSDGTISSGVIREILPVKLTSTGFELVKPFETTDYSISSFDYDQANKTYVSGDGGRTTVIGASNYSASLDITERFDYYFFQPFTETRYFYSSQNVLELDLMDRLTQLYILFDTSSLGRAFSFIEELNTETNEIEEVPVIMNMDYIVTEDKRVIFGLRGSIPSADFIPLADILFDDEGFYVMKVEEVAMSSSEIYRFISAKTPSTYFSTIGGKF